MEYFLFLIIMSSNSYSGIQTLHHPLPLIPLLINTQEVVELVVLSVVEVIEKVVEAVVDIVLVAHPFLMEMVPLLVYFPLG